MNLDYLKEISGNDKIFIDEILNTYLEEVPKDVQHLKESIIKGDMLNICSIAHKLKSSLIMLGFEELSILAKEIELAKSNILEEHYFREEVNHFVEKVEESLLIINDYIINFILCNCNFLCQCWFWGWVYLPCAIVDMEHSLQYFSCYSFTL